MTQTATITADQIFDAAYRAIRRAAAGESGKTETDARKTLQSARHYTRTGTCWREGHGYVSSTVATVLRLA